MDEQMPASLETDVFPRLVARRMLRGLPAEGYFVDMGIPDDLDAARREINTRRARPAAFLDRDGVLNKDDGYTHRPSDLVWIDGAPNVIRILNNAGYYVIVVTNQSGVARGYFGEDAVRAFHARMQDLLLAAGAHIDAFYHCPHHPAGTREPFSVHCRCRKPGPGLLEQAAQDWPIDVGRSFLIGDKDSDLAAAATFGVRGSKFDQSTMSLSALVTREILASGGSFA
jgi:D-glycero-D-manno-heptose 1,7-bisphosphate phosphatase